MTDYLAGDPPVPSSPGAWLRAICADLIRWQGQPVDRQKLDRYIADELSCAAREPLLNPEACIEKAYEWQRAAGDAALSKEDRKAAGREFLNLLGTAIKDCCAKSLIATVSGDKAGAWHYVMIAQRLRGRLDTMESLTGPDRPKLAGESAEIAALAKQRFAAERRIAVLPLLLQALAEHRLQTPSTKLTRIKIAEDMVRLENQRPTKLDPELTVQFAQLMLSELFKQRAWPPTDAQVHEKIAELRRN